MWCERVIRNHGESSAIDRAIDWVDIEWNQCGRVLKALSRAGQPVRVLLPPGERLHHNDVIFEDGKLAVVINVLPCAVIVANVSDARTLALLALEMGNLHLPVQIQSDQLIFIEDGPAMEVLDAMGIHWTKEVRRFEPAAVISAPGVNVAPSLRVIIRSKDDDAASESEAGQALGLADSRNSASKV